MGFDVRATNRESEGGKIDWTLLRLGQSEIMLNAGGLPSSASRREFDLYIHVKDVNEVRTRIDGKAEIVEELNETFYGVREFIIRDCNGFWITFGQSKSTSE
ncbi:VOC family protein [Occallatibacter savannae]|uniref:VOC family protein n=1 Tax=Occallatibacter savannae TaxID=1002691 RepID=UPI000D69C42B|nr:hypothetical protein [Occallatibacter savannae]